MDNIKNTKSDFFRGIHNKMWFGIRVPLNSVVRSEVWRYAIDKIGDNTYNQAIRRTRDKLKLEFNA